VPYSADTRLSVLLPALRGSYSASREGIDNGRFEVVGGMLAQRNVDDGLKAMMTEAKRTIDTSEAEECLSATIERE
jgi:hypothetical protein